MTDDVLAAVRGLASWSGWVPWTDAVRTAPTAPGVYIAREASDGPVVYVGKAGERAASRPGVRGRLGVYASGKAAVSGLGEAVLDRALADPNWLRARAEAADAGRPARAKDWAKDAFDRLDLHVCWATAPDGDAAAALERKAIAALGASGALWNRRL